MSHSLAQKYAQNKQTQQEATTRVNQIKKTKQNQVGVSEGKKKHTRWESFFKTKKGKKKISKGKQQIWWDEICMGC